ncbi:epoxide hydrolase [Baekduia soli]|uniref:Epoxide hydrolase n=1 Tax=Baekduia soli TaxID=496014 RepID=A0A5B8U7D3_9ACTN|nr:epoxide hydrolase family protein [Baekduia soli]QEC49013.1 epoxide hydrolase [Baekduia soli]
MPTPFRLEVADAELDDLHDRLRRTRWAAPLPGEPWERGVPAGYLRELADYWRTAYDWRRQEARINALPQFTTTISGTTIHFAHVRSPEPGALPLIITHGWPGSIVEFLEIIGPLSDPRAHGGDPADAFDVVVPSLPGYVLSGPTPDTGWDTRRIAAAWAQLMRELGYDRYGAQGGDWGGIVTRQLGVDDAGHVLGVHLNTLFTFPSGDPEEAERLTAEDRRRMDRGRHYNRELSGYFKIQATRPQTLAYGLEDSPVGLLAWIVEKFREWTDAPAVPEDAVDRDAMLTNVMLYWLTRTAGSSAQLYYEFVHGGGTRALAPSSTPTAVAVFPHDIALPVRAFAERDNAIARWTEFPSGGHFAAMEEPEALVGDIRAFFRTLR